MDLETGSNVFEKFEIIEHIGAGGMASVYKARHIHLDRIVVLKILKTDTVKDSSVVRFHNEAKIVSQLSHTNINQFFDFGLSSDNQPYLAIDFISGKTLDEIIKEDFNRLYLVDKINIACQLCDALIYAHGKNIIHRDVKPSNVIIQETDNELNAILLDFGIARILADDRKKDHSITQTGELIGSPYYMSPEQASGGRVNEKTDQYSLGCLIYAMFAKKPPLCGESTLETVSLRKNNPVPSLNSLSIDPVPEILDEAVLKMLNADENIRFDSIDDVKSKLQEAFVIDEERDEEIAAQPESLEETLILKATENDTGRSYLVPAVSSCLALVLIIIIYYVSADFHKKKEDEQTKPNTKIELTDRIPFPDENKVSDNEKSNDSTNKLEISIFKPEHFKELSSFPNLQELKITLDKDLPDNILDKFASLPKLITLHFQPSKFQFKSLKVFSNMKYLQSLIFTGTTLTDGQLDDLKNIKTLHDLDISDTNVTEKGFLKLKNIPSLRRVSVSPELFFSKSTDVLARSMPFCEFIKLGKSPNKERSPEENRAPNRRNSIIATYMDSEVERINRIRNPIEQKKQKVALLQKCLEMARKAQGSDSPAVARCLIRIIKVKLDLEQFEEALNLCDLVEKISTIDGDLPNNAIAEGFRSEVFMRTNRFKDCVKSARLSRESYKKYWKYQDNAIFILFHREIDALNKSNQLERAAEVAEQFADYAQKWYGDQEERTGAAIFYAILQNDKLMARNIDRSAQLERRFHELKKSWHKRHDPYRRAVPEGESEWIRMIEGNKIWAKYAPVDEKIKLYSENLKRYKSINKFGKKYLYHKSDDLISLAALYQQKKEFEKAIATYKKAINTADSIENCVDPRQIGYRIGLLNLYKALDLNFEAERLEKEIQFRQKRSTKPVK